MDRQVVGAVVTVVVVIVVIVVIVVTLTYRRRKNRTSRKRKGRRRRVLLGVGEGVRPPSLYMVAHPRERRSMTTTLGVTTETYSMLSKRSRGMGRSYSSSSSNNNSSRRRTTTTTTTTIISKTETGDIGVILT